MKKLFTIAVAVALSIASVPAQEADSEKPAKYRRSSLFTVLIQHTDTDFGQEIVDVFLTMPTPDKFDNHDICPTPKTFDSSAEGKTKKKTQGDVNIADIEKYMTDNGVARELVAKWFNRCGETGAFNMELISERGNYDASLSDVQLAEMGSRGLATLSDAGEELIGNTFVLVNDITYVNKEEKTKKIGGWMKIAGAVAENFVGGAESLGNAAGDLTESFKGFQVKITSYLYRLDWTEEAAAIFYQDYWIDSSNPDQARREAFDADNETFKTTYIGSHSSTAGNLAIKGLTQQTDEAMIRKVCTRAIDRSIVELQREHDEFKVKVPIKSIDQEGNIYVEVGLKEGLNEKSQFEVLEQVEDEDGKTTYKKIGVIAPVKGQIWDNRFMAAEEAEEMKKAGVKNEDAEAAGGNVNLTATQFRKVSGSKLYPGLLVREVTIKKV